MNPILLVGAGLMVVAVATVVSIMLLRWAGREVREYGVREAGPVDAVEVDLRESLAGPEAAAGEGTRRLRDAG